MHFHLTFVGQKKNSKNSNTQSRTIADVPCNIAGLRLTAAVAARMPSLHYSSVPYHIVKSGDHFDWR